MTGEQKRNIQEMRQQGLSYARISDSLNLSVNTVKSFCRRNNLSVHNASKDTENKDNKEKCKQCGRRLNQVPKCKPKSFCDDQCRYAWWSAHRDRLNRKAIYQMTCANCGRPFDSYGNQNRKYCCHDCYIAGRFGKEARP